MTQYDKKRIENAIWTLQQYEKEIGALSTSEIYSGLCDIPSVDRMFYELNNLKCIVINYLLEEI